MQEQHNDSMTPPPCPLLALPPELLSSIALHCCSARSLLRLSSTCTHLHALIISDPESSGALWLGLLISSGYPDVETITSDRAMQTAKERYCRQCDTVVSRNRMYYTGNVCINCEFSHPSSVWAPEPMES